MKNPFSFFYKKRRYNKEDINTAFEKAYNKLGIYFINDNQFETRTSAARLLCEMAVIDKSFIKVSDNIYQLNKQNEENSI